MYLRVESRYHGCRIAEYQFKGHRLIVLENRVLRAAVLATKGADILELRYKPLDIDVLWHPPENINIFPPGQFIASTPLDWPAVGLHRGNLLDFLVAGWFESLPNGDFPCVYRGAQLGQHGEVALLPWDVEVLTDTVDEVAVRFSVRTQRTPFLLERTMTLRGDEPVLYLDGRLVNTGAVDMAYSWGHHPGFGPPFVEEGCRIDLPPCTMWTMPLSDRRYPDNNRFPRETEAPWPWFTRADGSRVSVAEIPSPSVKTNDVVAYRDLSAGWGAVRNPRLPLGVGLRWDPDVFPYAWSWISYNGSQDWPYWGNMTIVTIQPFSMPHMSLPEADKRGLAPHLGAGQSIRGSLAAVFFTENAQVIGFEGNQPLFK
jgi:hypothetical protein